MAMIHVAPKATSVAPMEAAGDHAPITSPIKQRLDFLDGMRGLAALAVTVLHAFQMYGLGLSFLGITNERGGLGDSFMDQMILSAYELVFRHGHYAVEVFIVISGFSLMLAVARSQGGSIRGGLRGFFLRRARRILPPYYAAIVISLLLIAFVPGMNTKSNVYWDIALPALDWWVILSHLLFVQNLPYHDLGMRLNPPLWSIAVEEQIYWLFPVLVIIWRRWGSLVALSFAVLFGTVPMYVLPFTFPFSMSWYVGLFGMGMFAASICFSQRPTEIRWREQLPWGMFSMIGLIAFAAFLFGARHFQLSVTETWIDSLLGLTVACSLIYLTQANNRPLTRQSLVLRTFKAPVVVRLGLFSYSLYLMHAPILALIAVACRSSDLSASAAYLVVLAVGIPIALLAAYGFHLIFERPFMFHSSSRPAPAATQPQVTTT